VADFLIIVFLCVSAPLWHSLILGFLCASLPRAKPALSSVEGSRGVADFNSLKNKGNSPLSFPFGMAII